MKRAIVFLLLALFFLLVIDPNLSSHLQPEENKIPVYDSAAPLRTNDDVETRQSTSHAVIYIDPARGGKDTGYTRPKGVSEKDLLMQLALTIGDRLEEAGYQVVYSRWYDDVPACSSTEECEQARIAGAREAGADYVLALQMNQDDSLHQGFSLFTRPDNPLLLNLSRSIAEQIQNASYSRFEGLDTDHYDAFPVLAARDLNAILLQAGYITNPQDYARLSDSKFQNRIAEAVTQSFLSTVN